MCAGCHSTNLKKDYDLRSNDYRTAWIDVDVSCEACHGPGSNHVDWAQTRKPLLSDADRLGLKETRIERNSPRWSSTLAPPATRAVRRSRRCRSRACHFLTRIFPHCWKPGCIIRTASLTGRCSSTASAPVIAAAVADPDALVRMAAPRALSASATPSTAQAALSLLRDPIRVVRTETARVVAGMPSQTMSPEQRSAFAAAYDELVAAELTNEERPEAHLNLGLLHTRLAQPTEAETEYRTALRLDPDFVPALLNLADLDRMRGIDAQGEELLCKAMAIDPRNADVLHALGLSLVRQHNYAEALPLLPQAAELASDNVRYAYVYTIALNSTGSPEQSRAVLAETHKQHPADRDVLVALIAAARGSGDFARALSYARELAQLNPNDPQVKMLLSDLEKQANH
jgi:Flp pilus assembly protein TadD